MDMNEYGYIGEMLSSMWRNKEWIFSGSGVALITLAVTLARKKIKAISMQPTSKSFSSDINITSGEKAPIIKGSQNTINIS